MTRFFQIYQVSVICGGLFLAPSICAAPPPSLTQSQDTILEAATTSKKAAAAAASSAAQASLAADLAAAQSASDDLAKFLVQAEVPVPADHTVTADEPPDTQPLEVTPGPSDTVINCSGGMYFDADAGVLVYLKNVVVKDPRYDLSGADELKIFFAKKPVEAKPAESAPIAATETASPAPPDAKTNAKSPLGGDIGEKFGDVERIVATGAVRIDQKPVAGKEAIKASGRVFTYHLKEDRIILSGGYPWFTQGTTYMRAKKPNLTLQLFPKTGSFNTQGEWEMGGNLEQKKKVSP